MLKKIKTAFLVIVLSCLIWVFAEREVTQSTIIEVNLTKAVHLHEDLLVEFLDDQTNPIATMEKSRRISLTVEGPAGRILQVQQGQYEKNIVLDIVELIGSRPEETEPQIYEFDVVKQIFNGEYQYKDIYLKVLKSQPMTVKLQVRQLVQTTLPVVVYDADSQGELEVESREPAQVEAYLIAGQAVDAATVRLKPEQKLQATKAPIPVLAQVSLPDRVQTFDIMIKLPAESTLLPQDEIKAPRLGILWPESMEGKFHVEILDKSPLKEQPLKFRGTTAAITEYRESDYHLILEISASDKPNVLINRKLRYHLPPERLNEIEVLETNAILLQFQLIPILP